MSTLLRASRLPSNALDPAQLMSFTTFLADEIRAGAYAVEFNDQTRWHQRIYRDQRVDVWLISWLPTQCTQLHDHGGSSGAFTVVTGELSEASYVRHGDPLREHVRSAGATIGFGPHYVHDVRNLSDVPAVSIHAYSSRLTTMNFYDADGDDLTLLATLDTDDPEATFDDATHIAGAA
jgi:predicted metal-dependent enzyme (double-stranded beta helix superfamily)